MFSRLHDQARRDQETVVYEQAKKYREEISSSRLHAREKVNRISALDTKACRLVVIQILREIDTHAVTHAVTKNVIKEMKSYIETVQRLGEINIIAQQVGEKFFDPLRHIARSCDGILVDESTHMLWAELALWLDGFYEKVSCKYPRDDHGKPKLDSDGSYIAVDVQDAAMKRICGITKMEIALLQHDMSVSIDRNVREFRQFLPTLKYIAEHKDNSDIVTDCLGNNNLYLLSLKTVFREIIFKDESRAKFSKEDVRTFALTCKTAYRLFDSKLSDGHANSQQDKKTTFARLK